MDKANDVLGGSHANLAVQGANMTLPSPFSPPMMRPKWPGRQMHHPLAAGANTSWASRPPPKTLAMETVEQSHV